MPKTRQSEKLKAKVVDELLGPNPPSIAELAKKYKLAPALLDVWRRAALVQQRLKSPAAKQEAPARRPTSPPAPVTAPGREDDLEWLRSELAARDRRIAELLETVAGLSSLLVRKL